MGLFKRRTKLDFRRSLLRAILPDIKTPPPKELLILPASPEPAIDIEIVDEKKAAAAAVAIETVEVVESEPEPEPESEILLLPAEILRDIFSYLDNCELQALYYTHSRFRAIVLEHRSFFCRELASRNLRYFARYLKPAFFDLQRESRSQFLPKSSNNHNSNNDTGTDGSNENNDVADGRKYPGQANIPAWYLKLHKLDKITHELYALMPPDENEWELEYLRIQGLPPSQYNPRVWPRPGNPSFYFTHTIISFYQYNSLVKLPRDSLVDFKNRDIKPVCRCAQGYFRSTAHLGILCAVYMACLKFKTEDKSDNKEDLSLFLPELGGGLGNYIKGTRVSVKELFKMVVVVMYPGNLLKVIKDPSPETMARLRIVLGTLKDVLVRNEEERRKSGVDRMYTKGLEMMEGFAKYWETVEGEQERATLRFFDDWDLL